MAKIIRRVDPSVGIGTHFATFNLYEEAFGDVPGNGDCVTNTTIAVAELVNTGSVIDTSKVSFSGWTDTNSSYYVRVYVPYKYRHFGWWPSTSTKYIYRLDTSGETGYAIDAYDHNVRFYGLAVKSQSDCIIWNYPFGYKVTDSIVRDCVLHTTNNGRAIDFSSPANATVYAVNNILYNCNQGIYCGAGGGMTFVFYNNTIYEYGGFAIYIGTSTYTAHVHNNIGWKAVPGALNTFYHGPANASHNAYVVGGRGEGSNSIDISGYTAEQIFARPNLHDMHLCHRSPCFAKGKSLLVDDDGYYNVLDDIDRDSRTVFSIGADEGAFVPLFNSLGRIVIAGKSNSSLMRIRGI